MSLPKDIKDLSKDELVAWLAQHDIKPYRANQIQKWVYVRQADSFQEMTDLSKDLRDFLAEHFTIEAAWTF